MRHTMQWKSYEQKRTAEAKPRNGESCSGTAMKRNELALLGKALAARAVKGTAGEWHGSELEMQSLERAWK